MNEQEILNAGIRIGVALHSEEVSSAQVNKLLEILESEKEPKTAITLLAIYVQRQKARRRKGQREETEKGYIGEASAREITRILLRLLNTNIENKDEVRKILGTAKWVYEALEGYRGDPRALRNIQDPQSLLSKLGGGE